ncbi:MAG: SET domain-containing protein [Sphingomonas sp.]
MFLVAVRAIPPGEEITWDYSTTLRESNWAT